MGYYVVKFIYGPDTFQKVFKPGDIYFKTAYSSIM